MLTNGFCLWTGFQRPTFLIRADGRVQVRLKFACGMSTVRGDRGTSFSSVLLLIYSALLLPPFRLWILGSSGSPFFRASLLRLPLSSLRLLGLCTPLVKATFPSMLACASVALSLVEVKRV